MRPFIVPAALLLLTLLLPLAGCQNQPQETAKPASSADQPPAIGTIAPDFTLATLDGRNMSLSELRGKVVIVNFWATWCPPCREEMPSMDALQRELGDEGLVILAVNIEKDGRQTVARFFESLQVSFPVLLDERETVHKRYGVFKFPESFVVNKEGVIVEKIIGAIDWHDPRALDYFRKLLKG